jgi:hypothetical protein
MRGVKRALISLGWAFTASWLALGADSPAGAPAGMPADRAAARAELANELANALGQCVNGDARAPSNKRLLATSGEVPAFIHMPHPDNYYPLDEMQMGHQAIVQVEALIDALGNARFPHVVRALAPASRSHFASVSVQFIRDSQWRPAEHDGQPFAAWKDIKIRFIFKDLNRMGNILSDEKLTALVLKARNGDLEARETVSYLASVASSEVDIPEAEEDHYLAESALAGERQAALLAAQRLSPATCTKPPMVQEALRKQAWGGFSPAELLLATELIEAGNPASEHDIGVLLHGAANAIDPFVQLWATGLLATAPIEGIRDPAFALKSALSFKDSDDPDSLEALAAAQAENGLFEEAVTTEQRAIKQAHKYHWIDVKLRERLAAYQTNQPWVGYLCDCSRLVPGEGL